MSRRFVKLVALGLVSAQAVAVAAASSAQCQQAVPQQLAQDTPSAQSIRAAIAAAATGNSDPLNAIVSANGDDDLSAIANPLVQAIVNARDPATLGNLIASVLATGDSTLVATLVVATQSGGLKGAATTWGQALARSNNPDLVRSAVGQTQQLSRKVGDSLQHAVVEDADAKGYYGITEAANNPTTAPVVSPPSAPPSPPPPQR